MKNMRRLVVLRFLIFLGVLSLLLGCNETTSNFANTIDVAQLEVQNLFSFKRPIDNCRFVVLETTNECLIGEIDKVCIENNLIFIKDANENLFVFTMSGKFLNRIGSIGQGGEELLSFVDFYINKSKKYVGIYDVLRSKILRFTFDGKFISSHSCTKKMRESYNIIGQLGRNLLIGMRNNKESKYAYIAVNEKDYSFEKEYLPFSIIGNISCTPMRSIATYSKNGFYTTTYFSDSIFEFAQQNIPRPILLVKSEQKIADAKTLSSLNDMELETASDARSSLRKKGFSEGISNIYATDDFLNINYPMPNYQACNIFYCVESKKSYKSITSVGDFFGQSWGPALTTTNQEIVYALQPERILEIRKNPNLFADRKVLEPVENVQEEDNPVLAFFSSGYVADK
ncbi:6-bladed beta-propeller [uncultured Bacteroides sp.]|uniref:6-bladed beta-propeller n=1 Tax=uncultured Bacteroides sp. TaxID=162156 RepID=UPI002AABADB7|nr:6-bladed beta-propeller [uncultured Bacteroides sp.]